LTVLIGPTYSFEPNKKDLIEVPLRVLEELAGTAPASIGLTDLSILQA